MLWSTLFNRIGKQPLKITQHNHIYAVLENPKTHATERVYLELKYDAGGKPYFARSQKDYGTSNNGYHHKSKRRNKNYAQNSYPKRGL